MKFLLFICALCSTFSAAIVSPLATHPPQCAPYLPPAPAGPLLQPPSKAGTLFINEVLPLSEHTWDCSEVGTGKAKHNTWVELYNPQNQAFDLYSTHAAYDNGAGTQRAFLPFGAAIAAHGFFVIFPDPFYVHSGKSLLRLLFNGNVIDQVLVPPSLNYEQSYARMPDGGASWRVTSTPTIDASNIPPVVTPTPAHTSRSTKIVSSRLPSRIGSSTPGTVDLAPQNGEDGQPATPEGTQPAWGALQMPSTRKPSPVATSPLEDSPSTAPPASQATEDGADTPRKILFSSLATVLAGALFLCWRRFKPT